jgi:hypothetical protein
VGETICYHIGNLAYDRQDRERLTPFYFTDEAKILQTVADSIYNRSTANLCTQEFELKQRKISVDKYEYLAKRIKKF